METLARGLRENRPFGVSGQADKITGAQQDLNHSGAGCGQAYQEQGDRLDAAHQEGDGMRTRKAPAIPWAMTKVVLPQPLK